MDVLQRETLVYVKKTAMRHERGESETDVTVTSKQSAQRDRGIDCKESDVGLY